MRKILCPAFALMVAAILVVPHAMAQETRTAKERSSRKWFDEQRVDNCRVPLELRGTAPRPGCPDERTSRAERAQSR